AVLDPGDLTPRVLRQPQEDPGGLIARQRRRDRELDSCAPAGAGPSLLDPRHPLAAHANRRQHRVGASSGRRSLGYSDLGPPVARHIPVARARTEPCKQMAEHALLKLGPRLRVEPPAPEVRCFGYPRAKTLPRVIE